MERLVCEGGVVGWVRMTVGVCGEGPQSEAPWSDGGYGLWLGGVSTRGRRWGGPQFLGAYSLWAYNLGQPMLDLAPHSSPGAYSLGAYSPGGLQSGGLQSRTTDFGSGDPLIAWGL